MQFGVHVKQRSDGFSRSPAFERKPHIVEHQLIAIGILYNGGLKPQCFGQDIEQPCRREQVRDAGKCIDFDIDFGRFSALSARDPQTLDQRFCSLGSEWQDDAGQHMAIAFGHDPDSDPVPLPQRARSRLFPDANGLTTANQIADEESLARRHVADFVQTHC